MIQNSSPLSGARPTRISRIFNPRKTGHPNSSSHSKTKGVSYRGCLGSQEPLRLTERPIKPGKTVFVLGTYKEEAPDPKHPPVANYPDKVYPGLKEGDFFILDNENLKKPESSFGLKSFFGIFDRIAPVGVCLYLIVKMIALSWT
jgi:hypothetical protein